jgi:membrane protein DedA with SNARE-associated domain
MGNLLHAISHHGYLLVFAIVLAEASGLPAPAALALVAGGAAAAAHLLSLPAIFLTALVAMMLGDSVLFFLGRYTGWALLGFLCRLSLNPETCILRSAESFYKRGRVTLLFAKFIPGVNTMAPPLAGSMKMKSAQFLQLDLAGACLYILAYGAVGYVFRDFLVKITRGLQSAGHAMAEVVLVAIVVFAVYRIVQYRRYSMTGIVPRVAVEELARILSSPTREDVVLADVRSHGYYDPGSARIAGSIRLEPNRLAEELKSLPKDKDIYVYCT